MEEEGGREQKPGPWGHSYAADGRAGGSQLPSTRHSPPPFRSSQLEPANALVTALLRTSWDPGPHPRFKHLAGSRRPSDQTQAAAQQAQPASPSLLWASLPEPPSAPQAWGFPTWAETHSWVVKST